MKAQIGVVELTEHIRAEARRQRGETVPAITDASASAGGDASAPPSFAPPPPGAAFLEGIVAEAGHLVAKARQKVAVPASVPKFLRPFYRNQGGYNGVVLETLDGLCDVNRQLVAENARLREHLARQEEWMHGVARGLHGLHTRLAILEHLRETADGAVGVSEAASPPTPPAA